MGKKFEKLFLEITGNIAAYAVGIGLTLTSVGFLIWSAKWVCSLLGLFGL